MGKKYTSIFIFKTKISTFVPREKRRDHVENQNTVDLLRTVALPVAGKQYGSESPVGQ